MSLTAPKFAFCLMMLLAAGCIACTYLQSSFFYKFSLKELVQRNKSNGGLNCSASGGGGGIGTGGGGMGKGQSHFHRGESFSCQISDAEQFDEVNFIQALKQTVEKDLDASKAKIVSSGNPDAASFYFEYAMEDTSGRVEISGTRSPGNYYTLKADLDEKSGAK